MANSIKAITMPKWGMEMSEGDIAEWHCSIGDQVNVGDDLVDVETSKIVNTVTATDSGILRAIVAASGETHVVGALLGVLANAATTDDEIEAFISAGTGAAAVPTAPEDAGPSVANNPEPEAVEQASSVSGNLSELASGGDDSNVAASPVARRLATRYGVNLNHIEGTGRHGRVSKHDLEKVIAAAGGKVETPTGASLASSPRDDSDVKATPVARRLAQKLGINLLDCRASGNRQRVCKADVEAAAAIAGTVPTPQSSVTDEKLAAEPAFSESAMTGMRKTIASRLQSSKQTAPHFRVNIDAEIDALLAVRMQLNTVTPEAKISVNDFLIKACACALTKVPEVNIQFNGDTIRQFKDVDIAVAVAIEHGLITPIIRKANQKGLITISNEMRDLTTRARLGTLKPEEFQGGSFSISNLGMYGIKQFDAIINPPQSAILAIGAGEQRPVVRNGELAVATVVSLSLSSDHRVIDGALAARFIAVLKQFIEQPATMLG
jgi:pyruvate dehydrogenase E2 component (dihydrolipoamide acetyltransferase)